VRLLRDILFSIIAWPVVALLTVLFWVLVILAWSTHLFGDPLLARAQRFSALWGKTLIALSPGVSVKIYGLENLPKDQPVILMPDHQSYIDIPVMSRVPLHFKWMADVGLFKIPFMGWSMGLSGYIPVNRGDGRDAVRSLHKAAEWLGKGVSVVLFPEGTRSHSGQFGRFRRGGFRLAAKTQSLIVPVVLVGTRQLLGRNSLLIRFWTQPEIHILPAVRPVLEGDPKALSVLARKTRADMLRVYRRRIGAFKKR